MIVFRILFGINFLIVGDIKFLMARLKKFGKLGLFCFIMEQMLDSIELTLTSFGTSRFVYLMFFEMFHNLYVCKY